MKNLPPFYIGQRVVCLEGFSKYKKGKIYTVGALFKTDCCNVWKVGCIKIKGSSDDMFECACGAKPVFIPIPYYVLSAKFFAPINENFQPISLEKVLETELISVN